MNPLIRRTALVVALASCGSAYAQSTTALQFQGRDGDWFNPANWSAQRVPGPGDDVVLDRGAVVVIDPARGSAMVEIRDLTLRDGSQLTTLPGTILSLRDEHIGAARLIHRSTGVIGEGLYVEPQPIPSTIWCTQCGVGYGNPSPKTKRIIVLSSSFTTNMGLGGVTPARILRDASGALQVAAGPGHYATLSAETTVISGHLWMDLVYGFRPAPGDSFELLSSKRFAQGQFTGLPEGSLAGCTADGVGLRISYAGGDGNDVVLSAQRTDPRSCAAPTVQPIGPEVAPGTPGWTTREHILLARQVGVPH
ncbi:MAG: hypothetical protein ABI411_04150 [Tahibacter sp.]